MENRVENCTKTLEVQDEVKEVDGEIEDVEIETNETEQAGENMVDDHLWREGEREGVGERERERERESALNQMYLLTMHDLHNVIYAVLY